MIPPADVTTLIPTTPAGGASSAPAIAPSADAATIATALTQNSQNILTQVAVGRLLQAQVLAQLEDGSYIVGVDDSALRMSLPEGTSVGSQLQMTFLGDSPRPTFLLEGQTDASSAQLSSAGKIISDVLQNAGDANAPTTVAGKTPILSEPGADAQHIAGAMQDSVEFSGLFYESHVSQWATGERPITDLLREPQMQADADAERAASAENGQAAQASSARTQNAAAQADSAMLRRPGTSETDLASLIDNARTSADTRTPLGQALATLLGNNRGLPTDVDTMVKPTAITPENSQTIHLQLNTLEQNRFIWQGELWPGQHMEWEIQEEENRDGPGAQSDPDQSVWHSTVRFDLPRLGRVAATIHLSGGHVQMHVAAASNGTAGKLRMHGQALADALGDAGSPLDSLSISQDEQA
jgi:hypothetical protein